MDCSLPCFSVHGIFQATVLEWIAISFSRGSSQLRAQTCVSHIVDRRLVMPNSFVTPVCQDPLSMAFPGKNIGVSCYFIFRESSQYRGRFHIFCIGRQILYHWATREAYATLACLDLCHQLFPLLILGFVISTWQNIKTVVVILKLIWILVIWRSPLMI